MNSLICKEYQILQRFNREKWKFCDKIKENKIRKIWRKISVIL